MAAVTVEYRYADGECVTVVVDVENDYPDCSSTAKSIAIQGIKDLTGIGSESHADE